MLDDGNNVCMYVRTYVALLAVYLLLGLCALLHVLI